MIWSILIFVVAVVALGVMLKLFKVGVKTILKLVVNALVGGLILFLLNLIPGVHLIVTWWTALLTGIFGFPAVLINFIVSWFI